MSGMLDDNGNLTRQCGAACSGIRSRATVPPVSRGLGLSSKVVFFRESGGFLECEGESLVKAENKEDSLPIFSPPINPISSPPTISERASWFRSRGRRRRRARPLHHRYRHPTHSLTLTHSAASAGLFPHSLPSSGGTERAGFLRCEMRRWPKSAKIHIVMMTLVTSTPTGAGAVRRRRWILGAG